MRRACSGALFLKRAGQNQAACQLRSAMAGWERPLTMIMRWRQVGAWITAVCLLSGVGQYRAQGQAEAGRPQLKAAEAATRKTAAGGASPINLVSKVRSLSPAEAEKQRPVRLTGIVTVVSGYRNSFFLRDASAGISIDRTDSADVHVNDRVEVTGKTGAGLFAPVVLASAVRVLGHATPPAPQHISYDELAGGTMDSQWIEIDGVVHSAWIEKVFGKDVLNLRLVGDGGSIKILLQDFAGLDASRLVDATIRFRGVCATSFNEKRQYVGASLFVPERADMHVLEPARSDAFAGPATPVRETLQFGRSPHRLKVAGVVTYQQPGHVVYLQDGADGIRIEDGSRQVVPVGSRVEAVGFPKMGEYAPELADGVVRMTGPGAPLRPLPIRAQDVIQQKNGFTLTPYDEELVQLDGKVLESHRQGDRHVLILRQQDLVFEASLPLAEAVPREAEPGSTLRVVGICTVHTDADRRPVSFSLLLRTGRDVEVLERNPWWTLSHMLMMLLATGSVTLLVVLWVMILRQRVKEQTRAIRESESRFRHLAEHDLLTGLPNRLLLEQHSEQCLARCGMSHRYAALFTIEVDRFKHLGEFYGRQIADACLRAVAHKLKDHVRHSDTLSRTGGEEFTLIAGDLVSAENAVKIASALLSLFDEPLVLAGQEIKVTLSIGGAIYPIDGREVETLRRRSDQALFEAKRTGRNRVVFATDEIAASSEEAVLLESALRESLEANRFMLFYQPICDGTGAIRRYEALVRATDERLRTAGPAKFIPVAEESGLIVSLGRWVLTEACRQIAEWREQGLPECPVNVNISGRQLLHRGFADELAGLLERYQVPPSMLELELTETAVMTEPGALADMVAQLADAGHCFAIDDFGTGYSSLSRLRELPIQTLKIDRSFVMNLERNSNAYTIILAITQMAKSLGLEVVAEGVETAEQFEMLRDLECDFFQGYLFARPLTAAGAVEALEENRTKLLAMSL